MRGSSAEPGGTSTLHGTARPAAANRSRASFLFVLASAASGGLPGSPSARGDAGGKYHGSIANREDTVNRSVTGGRDDRRDRRFLFVKADRHRAVPPGIVETMAPISAEDQLDPGPAAASPNDRS